MSERAVLEAAVREAEWRKCRDDCVYFLNTYWPIEDIEDGGYKVRGLRDYQKGEVESMVAAMRGDESDRQIRLKARQIGWTTVAFGVAFWDAFFHEHHPWLSTQQSEDEAKEQLQKKVKNPYVRLPAWMRERGPALLTENMQEMKFANGSSISATHSSDTAARGRASYGVLMDEAAFIEDAEGLFGALDPQCYGPLFVFSTANGIGNWFHETWLDSQLPDSEWRAGFQPWHVVPGRDQAWYERTKRRYRTSEWLFYQEFPADPSEAFAKSGRTALPLNILEADPHYWTLPEWRLDISMLDLTVVPGELAPLPEDGSIIEGSDQRDFELHIWELPTVERDAFGIVLRPPSYVVSVDVSEGLEGGDYSAINVFNANTLEQVASMKAHVPVEDLGALVEWIGYWYHTALVLVERNNMGLVPLQYLSQAQYPRLYRMDTIAQQKRGVRTPRYGWYTNKATKPKLVVDMLRALRDEALILRDPRFLAEARTFLADGRGGYGASAGQHDDLMMAVLIGWQGCLDVGQYPLVYVDRTDRPLTMDEVLAVSFPPPEANWQPYGAPIGQARKPRAAKKTVTLHPANVSTFRFRE